MNRTQIDLGNWPRYPALEFILKDMTHLNTWIIGRSMAFVKPLIIGTARPPAQVLVRLPYRGYSKHFCYYRGHLVKSHILYIYIFIQTLSNLHICRVEEPLICSLYFCTLVWFVTDWRSERFVFIWQFNS